MKPLSAHRRRCLRTFGQVHKLRQCVQVFTLRPAGNILVAYVVHKRPLVGKDTGHPLYNDPLRAPGLHGRARKVFVLLHQPGLQGFYAGVCKLVFGVAHFVT